MPYLGRGPGFGIRQKYFYTASADDTSVSGSDNNGITLSFTDTLFIDVFIRLYNCLRGFSSRNKLSVSC